MTFVDFIIGAPLVIMLWGGALAWIALLYKLLKS